MFVLKYSSKFNFEVKNMMIEPPIDDLVRNAGGNRYVLCTIITKRAKEIATVHRLELENMDKKAISLACEEVFQKKVVPSEI